jgi:flagellar protein FliO/FliZ
MNIAPHTILILALTGNSPVFAQSASVTKPTAQIVSSGAVLQWVFALLFVLIAFGCLVWLLKRSGHFALTGKNQMSVVSALSLGMREKLVLVNIGEKQLLLGVTPGRIDKLLELVGDDRLYRSQIGGAVDSGLFAQKLHDVLKGKANV